MVSIVLTTIFKFGDNNLVSIKLSWNSSQLQLLGPEFKGDRGGYRPKFWFYMFLVANLVYFHLLFTEFEKFDRLAHN